MRRRHVLAGALAGCVVAGRVGGFFGGFFGSFFGSPIGSPIGLTARGTGHASAAARRTLTVAAASSLKEPFEDLGRKFESRHGDAVVRFSFAGSQELRVQLQQGAPADVFASADTRQMDLLAEGHLVVAPRVFAQNQLVVVVPAGDGARAPLRSFAELPTVTRLVVAAPEVPAGRYFLEILDRTASRFGGDFRSRVLARVVSRELNVRQVLAKVALGEADAGVVYRTDVRAARGKVGVVAIPAEVSVPALYPIAALTASRAPDLARDFVALVTSPEGRAVLEAAGFLPASPLQVRAK